MPVPTWIQPGRAVHTDGPATTAGIVSVHEDGFTAVRLGTVNETIDFDVEDVIAGRVTPHRWILQLEPMSGPFMARVIYNPGDSFEARPGMHVPPFPVYVGMTLMQRPTLGPVRLYRVTRVRPGQDAIYCEGFAAPMMFTSAAEHFIPFETPEVGDVWRRVNTFLDVHVLDVTQSTDPLDCQVTFQTPNQGAHTQSLIDFALEYECHNNVIGTPRWVGVGAVIANIRTGREELIRGYDPATTIATLRAGQTTLDELIREWCPYGMEVTPVPLTAYRDTYWGFVNPGALVRVVDCHCTNGSFDQATLTLAVAGSSYQCSMTGHELGTRAVQLPFEVVLPARPPWSTWRVGSMRLLADSRYVYIADQTSETTTLVSDAELDDIDLEAADLIEAADLVESMLRTSQGITDEAPSSLLRYSNIRNSVAARRARAHHADADIAPASMVAGSLWAWPSPPALVEVVDETLVTVRVRIVPTQIIDDVPRAVFDVHAVELPYRSRLEEGFDLVPGTLLDVEGGRVAVGETLDGTVVLYSARSLDGHTADAYGAVRNLGAPPRTLGYSQVQVVLDPLAAPSSSDVSVQVGQTWCVRFGPVESVFRVSRIAADHDAVWLRPIDGGADRPISETELRRLGSIVVGYDAGPHDATSNEDEWVETATRYRGHVLSYDVATRSVKFRWTANVSPREAQLPIAEFLKGFRALSPEGHQKATNLREAPGRPAWARLLRPKPTG